MPDGPAWHAEEDKELRSDASDLARYARARYLRACELAADAELDDLPISHARKRWAAADRAEQAWLASVEARRDAYGSLFAAQWAAVLRHQAAAGASTPDHNPIPR